MNTSLEKTINNPSFQFLIAKIHLNSGVPMVNSAHKQLPKSGRNIHYLSAEGVSLDVPRFEQVFVRNLPSAQDFFAYFFGQSKK